MIVTRQWIQEYIDISKLSTVTICDALNSIGLEVDSVSKTFIPNGVVVGFVESCEKHPDADKLNICQVNIGSEVTQIVCGAKNVAANMYVPVATVGSVLGEDFKIKKAKLRGVDSHGMICSSTEIGLPKINDGILPLDDSIGKLIIGKELNEYTVFNDETIEIELTANRGDCLSIHGIARELGTYFNIPFIQRDFQITTNNKGIGQIFEASYDVACEANLSYKAANIKDFKLTLVENLRASTVDCLKNTDIETAVAYTTHSTGVLLNVYTKSIATEQSNNLVSLKIKKDENDFDCVEGKVLLSTIGIEAGHISNLSDQVIIEASYLDPDSLAQKVFDKKIKTGDIYYKASRGSEPNLNFGMEYIAQLISKNSGTIYTGSQDFINELNQTILTVQVEKINKIIGQTIEKHEIVKILVSLGFEVKPHGGETLTITIPNFRHDIKNIADITEEIVRIIGIDKIKSKPLQIAETNSINNSSNSLVISNEIRAKAISNNFFETITYVFSNKEQLEKYGFQTVSKKKDILNPIVNELNTFRTTFALNHINAVSHNQKQGFKTIALFETGIIFNEKREESKTIGFVYSGFEDVENIKNCAKPKKIEFFTFAQKISNIIGEFELEDMKEIPNNFIHPYQSASIIKDGINIGQIYKVHPTVADDFDIDRDTFFAQIDFEKLSNDIVFASNISKYQSSKRDLSIVAPKSLEYKEIKNTIEQLKIKEIKQFNLVDIYHDQKLGDNESLTIKFILQSETKTMEENEINEIMNSILESLQEKLNIGLR